MAKFFALGRGGDFCKLSVCQKPKSAVFSVLVLRKTKLELLFCIFIPYYLPCNENVRLDYQPLFGNVEFCLLFQDDTYLRWPNTVLARAFADAN